MDTPTDPAPPSPAQQRLLDAPFPPNPAICILGAGAIGGLLGVRIAHAGVARVSMVARGAHLQAIRNAGGLKLIMADGEEILASNATYTDDIASLPPQDVVILAVKDHHLASLLPSLPSLLHETTILLTTQNGVPFWFLCRFRSLPPPLAHLADAPVHAVDPAGELASGIEPFRILHAVTFPAAHVAQPGVVVHTEGLRFPVGEIGGEITRRAQGVAHLLSAAGFKSFVLEDVRAETWLKLWGSVAFNPISALTHATLEDMCGYEPARVLIVKVMEEAQAVGESFGILMRVPMEKRIQGAQAVGQHKTSMCQDVEAGRQMEIETLLGAVRELARAAGVPAPHVDTLYACMMLLQKVINDEKVKIIPVKINDA